MESRIPILDLSPGIRAQWSEIQSALERVVQNTHFILGPEVKKFEEEAAAYLGVKHAVGLNSGTDALFIALRALSIGSGDEVITTPFTFFATAEAISHVGATPVFVDIDPLTFNLNVSQVEAKISSKTRAIIPVHLFGQTAAMEELLALASRRNLHLVEDTAQAFGADYRGKKLGSLGAFGCYSFFPSKNLGAFGDAGLLVTQDDQLAQKARVLRSHGSIKKYFNEEVGYNSRLDEIQAAILRVRLRRIDENNAGRRAAAIRYDELLGALKEVSAPIRGKDGQHVYHQYTIRVPVAKRDGLQKFLEAKGVATMIYYPKCLHQLPVYQSLRGCPYVQAEKAAGEVLSLPIWPEITAETQMEVATLIREGLRSL